MNNIVRNDVIPNRFYIIYELKYVLLHTICIGIYPYIFVILIIGISVSHSLASTIHENKNTIISYYQSQLNNDTTTWEEKLQYYDSLMNWLPKYSPYLLLGKAIILRDRGDKKSGTKALELYKKMNERKDIYNVKDYLEIQYTISLLSLRWEDPLKSLTWAGKLLSYPTPDSLNYYKAKAYLSLSNIFAYLEDEEKNESALNKGLELIEKEKKNMDYESYSLIKSGLLAGKADLMVKKKNYAEAFELYSRAKYLCPSHADRIDLNTGNIFSEQSQHDLGNKYYMHALINSSDSEIRGVAAYNLAFSYAQRKNYDKFLEFIDLHKDDLKYLHGRLPDATLWGLKSEAYENQGNYREALYAQRMADSIRNEVMPPEKIREIEREYQKINMREKDLEIEELKKNTQKKNTWLWVNSGIGLLLICGLIFMEHKNRKVKSEILKEEEKRKEEEQAHWNEIESWKDRQTNLETTLELRNQKMASMAMKLANMSEKMEELKETVSDPKAKKGDIVASVQSMLRGVSADGEVWESFMGYFEGVNQSFFDRLHVLHPDLTNAETRMCAFILLNRTTKEIATIINRSVRTVETIKYNLRKKLGITESTESYLRSISAGEKQISDDKS